MSKKELDLMIFLKSNGPNVRVDNLYETLVSILNNLKNCKYGFYLSLNNILKKPLNDFFGDNNVKKKIKKDDCLKLLHINFEDKTSWANDFNVFFDLYKDKAEWIMNSHDDLTINTDDFFNKTIERVGNKKEKIGWIVFSNDGYYKLYNKPVSDCVREGMFKDRKNFPCLFECHKFNRSHFGKVSENLHLLDYPESGKLVKAHATYSAMNLIYTENLKKIGYCSDWTAYTMLIDEDWGLEALKKNYQNIWIPDFFYTHPLRIGQRPTMNKWEKEAHTAFIKKWGFDSQYSDGIIKEIKQEYKNTLIPWTVDFNSYDWQYYE